MSLTVITVKPAYLLFQSDYFGSLLVYAHILSLLFLSLLGHQFLNGVHGCIGPTGFSKQNLALLVDGKYTSGSALGDFLEPNGSNQCRTGVAKE